MNMHGTGEITDRSIVRNCGRWAWLIEGRGLWFQLFGLWLVMACVQIVLRINAIPLMEFRDPDDSMRMVEVRDFLAGQSWFDVTQYRSFAPFGAPMHWSRLVDLPIAGLILLLRPFVGEHWAEVSAAVAVPLLTSAALFASVFWAMKSVFEEKAALFCCAVLMVSPTILFQFEPLRIDHHAWQITMAALVLGGVLHRDARLGGLVAGAAMAISLRISSEGLPLAALTGGVLTLRYAMDRAEWPRLSHYIWTLVLLSAALLLITQGWPGAGEVHCDSLSKVYLVPLACIPTTMSAGRRLLGEGSQLRRLIPASVGAGIAATVFLLADSECLAGPFSTMDPLIYSFWYKGVLEGLPIWKQSRVMGSMIVSPSLVALLGAGLAVMNERQPELRRNWLSILILAGGTALISIAVMRAMGVAHLMALPGSVWLIIAFHNRIVKFESALIRVPAMAALLLLTPVGSAGALATLFAKLDADTLPKSVPVHHSDIRRLNILSPHIIFAPLDLSPDILLETRHSVIGTGHHRNLKGIETVISAFLAPPDKARLIVQHTSATYLVIAPRAQETMRYTKFSPNGLAALLVKGNAPDWLTPVDLPGTRALMLYRIERSVPSPPATDRHSARPIAQHR